ncbi:Solitary outer membrane autotransporter beta-barrel domain [Vibrio olivae]|uniref:Solitary outer membrane autotransporter beta-barrel domain n=1 Tax=Vibrio olivae TaxID=1243002 RepID=A0ABV5HP60_9VIBR
MLLGLMGSIVNLHWKWIVLFFVVSQAQAEGYSFIEKFLEANFASAIVLSDSDFITLGMVDFDPNGLLHTDNPELGTTDSLKNRQAYSVFAFPYSWDLEHQQNASAFFRLSFTQTKEDIQWNEGSGSDDFSQLMIDVSGGYQYHYALSRSWSLEPSLRAHLMHYQNDVSYRSTFGQSVAPFLNGLIFNTSAWAIVYEPQLKVQYQHDTGWGSWNFFSSGHYFYGYGWGEANNGDVGNPEGWYVVNGVNLFYDMTEIMSSKISMYSSVKRVDLGSDVVKSLDAPHYYQITLGGLVAPSVDVPFVDNIGLGLSMNYGGAFKGGGIVLFLNQR